MGTQDPCHYLGLGTNQKRNPHFLGDFIGDWAKKKEEVAPSQSMALRLSNNKGTNLPLMASESTGENEVASRQRNNVPLVEHEVDSGQRHEM